MTEILQADGTIKKTDNRMDVKKGDIFTEDNVRSIRPGFGMHPRYLKDVLGKKVDRDIDKGTPLNWSLIKDLR